MSPTVNSLSHAQIVDLEARTQFVNQLQLFARQSTHVNHGTEHLSFSLELNWTLRFDLPSKTKWKKTAHFCELSCLSNGHQCPLGWPAKWRDYFSFTCGILQILKGSLFRNPQKSLEARSHDWIPLCDGNSKRVSWIPKQTNWFSDIKQVIWEILQIHTEGRVNRHRWDLLLFVQNLQS